MRDITKIKDKFYVVSSKKDKIYVLDKELNCTCKGFIRHGHCKHQKRVEEYIESGDWADFSRPAMIGIKQHNAVLRERIKR